MIQRLNKKYLYSVLAFVNECEDKWEDCYVTINKERKFLKNNIPLIKKILSRQEVYALIEKDIEGILIILHEKNFRPYVKCLAKDYKTTWSLVKFLNWNFSEELYAKLKTDNVLVKCLYRIGFQNRGFRGKELLLQRPKQEKRIFKSKDLEKGEKYVA